MQGSDLDADIHDFFHLSWFSLQIVLTLPTSWSFHDVRGGESIDHVTIRWPHIPSWPLYIYIYIYIYTCCLWVLYVLGHPGSWCQYEYAVKKLYLLWLPKVSQWSLLQWCCSVCPTLLQVWVSNEHLECINVSTYCTSIIIQHCDFFYCWKLNFWYWQFLQNRHSVDVGKGLLPGSIRKWAIICCLRVLKQHKYCTCHWMYYRYSTAGSDWGWDTHKNNYVTAHIHIYCSAY